MADPKLDVHDLLRQWERVVDAGKDAPGGGELYAFTARVINALPELARVFIQHDDHCRSIAFLAENNFEINIRFKSGVLDPEDVAKAYIATARLNGWKPPRECD